MKKRLLFGLVAVMLIGAKAQATQISGTDTSQQTTEQTAEQIDPNDVMKKSEEAMKSLKVYGIEMWLNGKMIMDVALDMNTQVLYGNIQMDEQYMTVWGDGNTKMAYMYDSEDGKYYFTPDEVDFSELQQETDSTIQTVKTDSTLAYAYVGKVTKTVKDQATECYQIHATLTQQGNTSTCEYYVSTKDYRVIAADMTMGGQSVTINSNMTCQMNFYYPDSLTIPAEVMAKATIAPGYSLEKDKVTYAVKYVKGQPVLKVISGNKAKKRVKIPDTITICGKAYPVYEIGDNAFSGNKKITSVTIGKNVQVIGKRAFYKCKKLSAVKVDSKLLKKVGQYAFKGTSGKYKIKVPSKKLAKYKKLFAKSKSLIELSK